MFPDHRLTKSLCILPTTAIVVQRVIYGTEPPVVPPDEEDILEQALRLEEEEEADAHSTLPAHSR